jgi:hypothetical protein
LRSEEAGKVDDIVQLVPTQSGGDFLVDAFSDGSEVAEAEIGEVGARWEVFVAEVALGLELAEFGGAFVQEAVGLSAGPVDGVLEFGGGLVLHRVDRTR